MAIVSYGVNIDPRPDMSRNVCDMYKKSLDAEIRADLTERRSDVRQILLNTENDFNIATAIRTANALNINGTYIVNRKRYDKRGTVGTHNYTHVFYSPDYREVFDQMRTDGYKIYAIEKIEGYTSTNLWDVDFPSKSAFVFGTENNGIPPEIIAETDGQIEITMLGSVRSFNLATCSAIVLAEWSRQHRNDLKYHSE